MKRKVRCAHSDDISKCPPCWVEFTGDGDKLRQQLITDLEQYKNFGTPFTEDMADHLLQFFRPTHIELLSGLMEKMPKREAIHKGFTLSPHSINAAHKQGVNDGYYLALDRAIAVIAAEIEKLEGK